MAISERDPRSDSRPQSDRPRSADRHQGPRPIWLTILPVVVVVLVLVGVTVPSGAPGHQLWTSVAGGTLTQAQADSQVTIQAVIQQANTEQSQALATGNPTLMSPTANAAYYRQLVQINQGLAAQGATAITLSQITWGAISVTGTTATATTTETWITTFSDGTTTESTDVNNYTLVDQGGAWLIESDQQPAATPALPAAGTQPAATPQPSAPAPLPAASVGQNTSHNWSGYAVASGTYTGVSGTWTVPQPRVTGAVGVGATWVGIGGVTTHDLIQAGTQDTSDGSGQAQFQTWIETLPQPSQQVPLAVVPGDSVTVSIDEAGASSGVWQISIKNNTSGQSYQTTVSYMSSESSAEWVEEAPSGGRGVLPLDQFNTVSFSAASATLNGQTVDLAQAHAQPITMLNANNQPLAVPSSIGGDGASFSVARTSAPATTSAAGGPGRQPGAPAPVPAPVPGRVPAPAP